MSTYMSTESSSSPNNLSSFKHNSNTNEFFHPKQLPFQKLSNTENNLSNIFNITNKKALVVRSDDFIDDVNEDLSSSMNSEISTINLNKTLTNKYENNLDYSVDHYKMPEKNHSNKHESCSYTTINKIDFNLTDINSHFIFKNEKKRMSDLLISELQSEYLIKNSKFYNKLDNSGKRKKSEQLNSKCHCKTFYSFNKDANKILTSKIKHFTFSINTEQNRHKFMHLKHLEANILRSLFINNEKRIVQFKTPLVKFKPILSNTKYEKCIDLKNCDHIKPRILNILKDVYVDVDYLSEHCDLNEGQYSNQEESRKNIVTKDKLINNINLVTNDHYTINSKIGDQFVVNFNPNKISKLDHENLKHNIDVKTSIEETSTIKSNNLFIKKTEDIDFVLQNSTIKENNINLDCSYKINSNLDTTHEIKIEKNDNNIITDYKSVFNPFQAFNTSTLVNENIILDKDPKISLTLPKNNQNKPENMLLNEINNSLQTEIIHVLKDEFEHETDPKMPLIFSVNNQNKSENMLLNQIETNSLQTEINHVLKDEFEHETDPKIPLIFSVNNQNKPENVLLNRIETNSLQTEIIHVLKDEFKHETDTLPLCTSKLSKKSLFDSNYFDTENSCNSSSDDDSKLQIEDYEDNFNLVHLKTNIDDSLFDNSKDSTLTDNYSSSNNNIKKDCTIANELSKDSKCLNTIIKPSSKISSIQDHSDDTTTAIQLGKDNKLLNTKSIQLPIIDVTKNNAVSKEISQEKELGLYTNKHNNLQTSKEENNSFNNCLFMTIDMCNNFYEKKSLIQNNNNLMNDFFSKNINDILTEMYVDKMFVSLCQHIVELSDTDVSLKTNNLLYQPDGKNINMTFEKKNCDIKTENDTINLNLSQPILFNSETIFKSDILDNNEIKKKLNKNTIIKEEKSISPQNSNKNNICLVSNQSILIETNAILSTETVDNIQLSKKKNTSSKNQKNTKSNIKVRLQLRELLKSNDPIYTTLESKEFRNLRFFSEEELANSIGVLLLEQTIDSPVITGLSVYRECYDHLDEAEKNKLLRSTNLNIACPIIIKLTSITLALVKMLRSDSLIDCILNAIRRYIFNKKMNTSHSTDYQLIKLTVYFVDICVRLRMLKTLQTFIFDSMVLIPHKYCCVIFISLLLWKNCLPVRVNDEQDPVIIMVLSFLIAKKKIYSEQLIGRDIFQQELMNLLSVHFNYSFSLDMPTNLIQHIHKPDFFVSMVMLIKCCHPKDLAEFVINCLFPIVEHYLNTQQNEAYAIQIIESLNISLKPFQISCNATVATYLSKCKKSIDSNKKEEKEHIYYSKYNSYKTIQNKCVKYFEDSQIRSPAFEESLVSTIMILGSVDYLTSCMALIKWKPKYKPSTIISKKFNMFKSVIDHNVWDKLFTIEDTNVIKCLINSCLLKKNEFNIIERLHALH